MPDEALGIAEPLRVARLRGSSVVGRWSAADLRTGERASLGLVLSMLCCGPRCVDLGCSLL